MTVQEYNQCVEQYADRVYRFILKNMKNADDAQDVVQNAFEILWKNHEGVSFEKSRSYLFTVAYHNMIDHFRKKKFDGEIGEEHEEQVQGSSYQYTGAKAAVELALKKLPAIQQQVVMLRDYEGYSYEEIGQITGLNESQVKVYIFRARTALKNFLVSAENAI
ncbi:MAG: RNA polymerase sigma factor [Bacteroidetes bacterium]|nr:RNA polymerase sigma factor [Bacteroidota bacterium]